MTRRLHASVIIASGLLFLAACGSDSDGTGASDGSGASDGTDVSSKLFADDFQPVCSGATQSRAADYESTTAHKVVFFQTYEDDLLDQSTTLPSDWTVTFDENADVYAQVDVVACAVRTSEELARTCEGYEDEEAGLSGGKVRWHTGTYQLTVLAAKTGEELGSTALEADDEDCPIIASFDQGETEIDGYAAPSKDDIVAFLRPFVQP